MKETSLQPLLSFRVPAEAGRAAGLGPGRMWMCGGPGVVAWRGPHREPRLSTSLADLRRSRNPAVHPLWRHVPRLALFVFGRSWTGHVSNCGSISMEWEPIVSSGCDASSRSDWAQRCTVE